MSSGSVKNNPVDLLFNHRSNKSLFLFPFLNEATSMSSTASAMLPALPGKTRSFNDCFYCETLLTLVKWNVKTKIMYTIIEK